MRNFLRLLSALTTLAGGATTLRAQIQLDPVKLAPVVFTATRLPESSATVGTAIDTLSGADLVREQQVSLADSLWGVPGVPVFATGRFGASSSVFLRGANSDQVLVLVDGIRFSDANTDYGPMLGSWRATVADNLEISRGPQSTLYGAEASGGLISISTPMGQGPNTASISGEGGSYGTVQGSAAAQGDWDGWHYNAALAAGRTDNGRTNNAFDSGNVALRLDRAMGPFVAVGGTLRGLDAKYGDPGDVFTNNPYNYEKEQDWLGTLHANVELTEQFTGLFTVGGQYRRFVTVEPTPGQPSDISVVRNNRGVFDGLITGQFTANNKLIGGFDLEDGRTIDTGFGEIHRSNTLIGVYLEDEFTPVPEVHVTGGVRRDDYSDFGGATTGRATIAWLGEGHLLKLRGSFGTGFNAPSFLDLYGNNPYFVGNPRLKPETSRGWDAGLDFYLPSDPTQVLSLTWFHTDFRNLIVDNFAVTPSTVANAGQARTQGLEVAWKTRLAGAIQARIAYTYLLAEDLTSDEPLARRPRDSGSADLYLDLQNGWTYGVGGVYVGQRADVDAQTFAPTDDSGYTAVRAYARWQFNSQLAFHVHVENALDKAYQPINGYPAPARTYFGGVEWKF